MIWHMVMLRMGFVLTVTKEMFGVTFSLIGLVLKFRTGFVLSVTIVMFGVTYSWIYLIVKFMTSQTSASSRTF